MRNKLKSLPLFLAVYYLLAINVYASTITFESVPGSSPADMLSISNQYEADYGVTFSTSTGGTPYLEAVGETDGSHGFFNDNRNLHDIEAIGYESGLGDYYLRLCTGFLLDAPSPSLIISYTNPVSAASAQIWDIDQHSNGFEQWLISAYDSGNTLLETLISPMGLFANDPNTLDGKPWTWSFDHDSIFDISLIEISFSTAPGAKTTGIGLAFDNFSPSSAAPVPEPSTFLLLGCGLTGLVFCIRRKKKG